MVLILAPPLNRFTSWSLNRVLYVSYMQEFYKAKESLQFYPAVVAVKQMPGNQVSSVYRGFLRDPCYNFKTNDRFI